MLFGVKVRWTVIAREKQNGSRSPLVSGTTGPEEGSQEADLPNETSPSELDRDHLMVGT